MKKFTFLTIALLVFSISNAFSQIKEDLKKFENISQAVKKEFAPDRRDKVYEARLDIAPDSTLILKGSTTEKQAKDALLKQLANSGIKVADKMVLLPDPALGGKTYGVTSLSTSFFRYDPDYAAESATQTVLGQPVRILESKDGWDRAQTLEGYIAWVPSTQIQPMTEKEFNEWKAAPKLILTKHYQLFREKPSQDSDVAMDGIWGSVVVKTGEQGSWYKVTLPNGKTAYIPKEGAMDFNKWLDTRNITAETLIATGKQMLGFTYLWGGTSIKAVDCSGFTKTTYFLNGVILRRDASQQALTGTNVDISNGYDNLKPGDLLFFGSKATPTRKERITHVGMYIGNGQFIHSSSWVHINSLITTAPDYNDVEKRLVRAQRILPNIDKDPGIVSIKKHPWYF